LIWYWQNRTVSYSLNRLYSAVGITKQAVSKHLQSARLASEMKAQFMVVIRQIRKDHPTMSLRSMYYKIRPTGIGRDRFEGLCTDWGFMIERKKNQKITTDSTAVIRFPNLIASLTVVSVNQVWVSDITYYEMNRRFYYLTFISDMYSKVIKGYSVSSSLQTLVTTIPALRMALRRYSIKAGLILHSDGGGQYYSKEFLSITAQHGIQNSMCKEAYQNPQAEPASTLPDNPRRDEALEFPSPPQNGEGNDVSNARIARWYFANEKKLRAFISQAPAPAHDPDKCLGGLSCIECAGPNAAVLKLVQEAHDLMKSDNDDGEIVHNAAPTQVPKSAQSPDALYIEAAEQSVQPNTVDTISDIFGDAELLES